MIESKRMPCPVATSISRILMKLFLIVMVVVCGTSRLLAENKAADDYAPMPWHLVDIWWDIGICWDSGDDLPFESYSVDVTISDDVSLDVNLYVAPIGIGHLNKTPSRADQSRTDGLFVSQEIVTAHKRQLARAVEAREVDRLGWEQEAQRMRVRNDLRIRYFEVLGAQQAILLGEELLRVAEEGVRVAEDFQRLNLGARIDVLQARIQRNVVRASLADARFRHRAAWEQLSTIIGRPGLPAARVLGDLDGPLPAFDWDASLARLIGASPQLRTAEVRLSHARAELRREQAQPIPNVTVQTVTEFDKTTGSTNVSTLLALPVPVYNRNQGNIFHASADIREAQAEIERVRLVLRDTLAESFRRYEVARNSVEQLRAEILSDAKENLELTTAGYKAGEFDFARVLAARQTYFQSNLSYIESLAELRKIVVEIEGLQLTGGLNPATLGTAIQTQGGFRQQGLLNQLQDSATKPVLPPAVQAASP